jgi:hypothetical protein
MTRRTTLGKSLFASMPQKNGTLNSIDIVKTMSSSCGEGDGMDNPKSKFLVLLLRGYVTNWNHICKNNVNH